MHVLSSVAMDLASCIVCKLYYPRVDPGWLANETARPADAIPVELVLSTPYIICIFGSVSESASTPRFKNDTDITALWTSEHIRPSVFVQDYAA